MCDDCGQTPKYIVADGKMTAPTIRKVQHLDELSPEEDDKQVWPHGSYIKDRVYLKRKKERKLVNNLLTENISICDFSSENMRSQTSLAGPSKTSLASTSQTSKGQK